MNKVKHPGEGPLLSRDLGLQRELSFKLRELCKSVTCFLDEGGSPAIAVRMIEARLKQLPIQKRSI